MEVTQMATDDHSQVTLPVRFAGDAFDTAMRKRGCHTERERASAAGISRMTLHRLRDNARELKQTPGCAHKLATASGLTIEALFPPIAAAPKAKAA